MDGVRRFLGSDIRHIASHPEEYSAFVFEKAERAAAGGPAKSEYESPPYRVSMQIAS